jgi:membrane protease YdiL (CAAX protease family)
MTKPIRLYILIAFAFTWVLVIGLYVLHRQGDLSLQQLNTYYAAGALGPSIAAWVTTHAFYKKEGLSRLLAAFQPRRLDTLSIAVALSPVLLFGAGYFLYPLLAAHPYSFQPVKKEFGLNHPLAYVSWMLPFVTYAFFEEPGWRGFLLPLLQERYTAFKSTCILTLFWGLWHAPFFLFRFQFSLFISIGFFFGLFVGALILTFIFNQSRGSLLAAILFHFTNNVASAFDKEYIVAVLSTGFVGIALYLLARFKGQHLAGRPRIGNYLKEPEATVLHPVQ